MSEPNLDRWARDVVEQSKGSISAGLGLTLAFHLVLLVITFFVVLAIVSTNLSIFLAFLPLMYIGSSQLVYMIPAFLVVQRRGSTETAKGLIIGAAITFLLNATCNGVLYFNR
jgi:ABC-type Fe3+-siderophore transport system permease subunit